MGLFADDGTYWVPAVPDQESPFDQASLFYDDRELMRDAGRAARASAYPRADSAVAHRAPDRQRLIEHADEAKGEYLVGSTLIMVEYRDDAQRVFAGRQRTGCGARAQASASCRSAST